MIRFVTVVLLLAWSWNWAIAESIFEDDYNRKFVYNSELGGDELQGSDSSKAAKADAPCGPTYKICRDFNATTTSGIIQPLDPMIVGPSPKMCSFSIVAPPGYRIQMTCSIVQISRSCSFLKLRDGQVILADPPTVDEVYTSNGNVIVVDSQLLHYGNTFDCKWTMIAPITTTTTSTTTQRPLATECGRSKFTSSRILGGTEANPNEFPWMVHLVVNKDGGPYTCAGTLISNQAFVTAMSCFLDSKGNLSWSGFTTITLGAHDFSSNSNDRNRQVVQWTSGQLGSWPQYAVEGDWAIFKLLKPAILNDYVQPACLPFANEPDHLNDPVVLTGWGDYIPGVPSPVLRKTTTTVISSAGTNGQCQQTAGIGPFSGNNIICSDGSKGRRLCKGERGGPLNYYNKELGRWFFIGIGMMGDESNCLTNCKPNVFTRAKAILPTLCAWSAVTPPDGKCS
ncbi:chymotrypsin-like elastase family member 2B [Daphnia pulicaria]|uniref:chymotrypsin-like elastase family member 2B n=1 Tax=Daphnia pulicaria TaxID=35523 RepID=UPI001EEBE511|nr:chymotrypsin-like elastase family member 2B [Daphnia pulicaria]